jgi:hypothetical protein
MAAGRNCPPQSRPNGVSPKRAHSSSKPLIIQGPDAEPEVYEGPTLHDLRYRLRLLMKNPGFSIVAILPSLASCMRGCSRSLPYREPNRLVMIFSSSPKMAVAATTSEVVDWRLSNHVFEQIEMYLPGSNPVAITAPGQPGRVQYQYVTQGFFPMFENEKDSIGSAPAEGCRGATEWPGRSTSDRIH